MLNSHHLQTPTPWLAQLFPLPTPGPLHGITAVGLLPPSPRDPPSLSTPLLRSLDPTASLASTHTAPRLSPPAEGAPFHLASSFAPIPAKLVKRIQSLEYVDLRELLPDNLALSEKLDALPARASQSTNPEQREITKIVTWVSCFSTYAAIVAQKHPERTRDMMAYMRLMVREGHKHGGTGWLKYDCIFRKNNPGPSASWDVLDPSLLTIVSNQGYNPRLPCHHCQELDHTSSECALAPLDRAGTQATRTSENGPPRMTQSDPPAATSLPRTPLGMAPAILAELSGRAYASRGIRGSALSKGPVPMPTSALPATVGLTEPATAPKPRLTPSSRGQLSHGSDCGQDHRPSARASHRAPITLYLCFCTLGPVTYMNVAAHDFAAQDTCNWYTSIIQSGAIELTRGYRMVLIYLHARTLITAPLSCILYAHTKLLLVLVTYARPCTPSDVLYPSQYPRSSSP